MEQAEPQQRTELREKGKPLVKDLNEHIVCPVCRGYLIDATTLVECLHSFCRGCIVRRFREGSKICPVCKTNAVAPLVSDIGLQRLVYLVVPGLFRSEQEKRRNFGQVNPQCTVLNQPPVGAPDLSFDDLVSLSLSDIDSTSDGSTRYLKCPAGVAVRHLLRLLMLKRGWDDIKGNSQQCGNNKIQMLYRVNRNAVKNDIEVLDPSWTLMDLACIFQWKRESPMNLLYRVVRVDETATDDKQNDFCKSGTVMVTESNSQAMENIQRPPTPPPSPKPTISRSDTARSMAVDQYSNSKEHESKKPRCEVTPVMRAPDPPSIDHRVKSGKVSKLDHQHKRKKRRNKRVIAEITTTPREDLLKLKVRLTPCPPRVTSNASSSDAMKDKLIQMRAVRKEKTKSSQPKDKLAKEHKATPRIIEDKILVMAKVEEEEEEAEAEAEAEAGAEEELEEKKEMARPPEKNEPVIEAKPNAEKEIKPVANSDGKEPERDETPKNEEVLRRLGLVAISEANKTRQEKTKNTLQTSQEKNDPAIEREKLEKQLRESKANRVRSLLAEKQMRDTLKSIMSNSKEGSTSRSGTPTSKRKDPPPLTPLRSAKRANVTFAPNSFPTGKNESPLDLSSPSTTSKDNALDLSSEALPVKSQQEIKPISILRNRTTDKPKDDSNKKPQESNLKTLSDAAVSLLGNNRTDYYLDKSAKLSQNLMSSPAANVGGKVALRIPQPHHRLTSFGMKIKPNIGVRHIPNPSAVVASQYRNQRTGYFNLTHQPP